MFSEVVNALFLTFLATEYHLATLSSHPPNSHDHPLTTTGPVGTMGHITTRLTRLQPHYATYAVLASLVALVNLTEHLAQDSAAHRAFHLLTARLLHVPRVLLAAILYVLVLYVDCQRIHRHRGRSPVPHHRFLRHVLKAFLYVAPIYPLLAITISFAFLFLLTAFERLGLSPQWLNTPIYYGTLYGPFSYMYFHVKRYIVRQQDRALPT